ncbi:MAG: MFS transporter [Hyphomicrobiaceae bacterium]|nr:MFS transporter [Hyphomicrobiaceae bacterium]
MATTSVGRSLILVFAILYFVQGIAEPTAGLLAQPVRSLLRSWGKNAEEIAAFMFLVAMPWNLKLVFGLLTDFVPIFRLRRKSYLIITSSLTLIGMGTAALIPLPPGSMTLLFLLLILPCIGVAFSDVVTDAYMVDKGQPLGLTGRLQSAQWTAMHTAGLLTGVLGGFLSQHGLQRAGFAICAALSLVTLYIALVHVDEKAEHRLKPDQLRHALATLRNAVTQRTVIVVASFLFLINFNPFSSDVLYVHMTKSLGFSEQFVGFTYTLNSVGSIAAGVLYGLFAPRIPVRYLVHGSIAFMCLASLVYIGLSTPAHAVAISLVYGLVYMITTLIQLDLAARYCPPLAAGTIFALLMSLTNLGTSSGSVFGGRFYTAWSPVLGAHRTFDILVLIGVAFTAACWLLNWFVRLDLLPPGSSAGTSREASPSKPDR